MRFLNIHKRAIAWSLVIAFSSLVNLQVFPLEKKALVIDESVVSASNEDMGLFEKGDQQNTIQKKKRFPWLWVILGTVAVGTAVYFLGFKNKKKEPIGKYTQITVGFNVLFQGNNHKSYYKVLVDGQTKIDETFIFDTHYSTTYGVWKKIERNFWIKKSGLGDMLIRVEAGETYDKVFPDETAYFVAVVFNLEVLSYEFAGGTDPGKPVLSETYFWLSASPGDKDIADRIKEKTITISAPPIINNR